MGGKDSDESDDDSVENLKRTEGLDAQAFSAPLDAGAAPVAPKYIRVFFCRNLINVRYGRITRSKKILITCSSRRNYSVLPIFAIQNPMHLPRMGLLLSLHQAFQTPFLDTKPVRYGQ